MYTNFVANLKSSARNCKNLRAMTIVAMLIALNLVLDKVALQVTPQLRIGVGFLTMAMTGFLVGPVMAMSAGLATDVLSFLATPRGDPYFPGYTISAIVGGFIYGAVLYRQKPTLARCFLAKGLINLVVNITLNTFWHSMLYGKAIAVMLPVRITKNLMLWPLESLLLYAVAKTVSEVVRRAGLSLSKS